MKKEMTKEEFIEEAKKLNYKEKWIKKIIKEEESKEIGFGY